MHPILSNTLPPTLSVLVILGFVAAIGLLFLIGNIVSLKMSGWQAIAERFPMRDVNFTGDSFKKRGGIVGDIGSGRRGFFDIRFASEGVCIYPAFARRKPCLIPWSAIRRVSFSDSSLLVVVEYERHFEFILPAESLPTFQAKLSSELFHKAVSPFDTANKILKDGTQPRWMSAIVGQVVRLAENEFEKEKQSRKGGHDGVV